MKKITIKSRVVGTDVIIEVQNGGGAKVILQEDISELFSEEEVQRKESQTVVDENLPTLPHTVQAEVVQEEEPVDKEAEDHD